MDIAPYMSRYPLEKVRGRGKGYSDPLWKGSRSLGLCWKAGGWLFSLYWRIGEPYATLKVRRIKSPALAEVEGVVRSVR
jgi:hypothetical protein